jgi:hypothetical protein
MALVDTPGFQAPDQVAADNAAHAVSDAAVVLYLFNPNLVTGSAIRLQETLKGDDDQGLPAKLERTLFIINRSDELGVDPDDSPEAFRRLCQSKRRELANALRSHGVDVDDDTPRIFCLASDPYGTVGDRGDVTKADYETCAGWDGFAAFRRALEQARPALGTHGVQASLLDGGIARLGRRLVELQRENATSQARLDQLTALRTNAVEADRLAENLAVEIRQTAQRIVGDFVEGLLAEALGDPLPERRVASAKRLTSWIDDDELEIALHQWMVRTARNIADWQRRTGESVEQRLSLATFRAAYPRLDEAVDVSFVSGISAIPAATEVTRAGATALKDVKPTTLRRLAAAGGGRLTEDGAAKAAANLARGAAAAAVILDLGLLIRDWNKDSAREEKRREKIAALRSQVTRYCDALVEGSAAEPGPVRVMGVRRQKVQRFVSDLDGRIGALEQELGQYRQRQGTCRALLEAARTQMEDEEAQAA